MVDPDRLLSQISDADEVERTLLGSLQRVEPPADAKGKAWERLSAQLAAVGVVGITQTSTAAAGSSAAAAAKSAGAALGSKLLVGFALVAGALGGSALWLESRARPSPSVVSSAAPPVPAPLLQPALPKLASAAPPTMPPLASPASARPAKPNAEQNPVDRLSAESTLLMQARAQLRSGDSAAAAQSLARLRANFPKGVLSQEREVLTIEVLAAQGNAEAARRHAKAFISAHPTSPHSAQLSRFADAP